ncbi:hypothetical protein DERF_005027 [Dermatophagoides farinae]|uniref:Uncharacterized protein n=1 Tax=Dermatophagoides farinae TaxID=6954 RepID=A0A922L659_DERFA|nr:hypothetical protein DERF_005027 [Dermatophagoides farinae]
MFKHFNFCLDTELFNHELMIRIMSIKCNLVQNDPIIPIKKVFNVMEKDFTFNFSYTRGNLINSNGTLWRIIMNSRYLMRLKRIFAESEFDCQLLDIEFNYSFDYQINR